MKRKQHGMVVFGVAIAAVAAIALYAVSGRWRGSEVVRRSPLQAEIQVKVPTEEQVRQMERLYDRLPMLAEPREREVAATPLSLFGYQATTSDEKRRRSSESLGQSELALSLVVVAGVGSYCIIDGDFVSEGTRMEDGTAILKIESHRVLVARGLERKWIYLQDADASSQTPLPDDASGQQRGQS